MAGTFEIRDPIHGFIELDDWERQIVDHPYFQRLRRIRQLGLTDMLYPGAVHTRFEHSLGVMHVATRMFDAIVRRRREFLREKYDFTDGGFERDRRIVRLAALLHDVGHPPFSHAGETDLMPQDGEGREYEHENYSAAIVASLMRDVIEEHSLNQNHEIKAQDIADFLEGKSSIGRRLFWRNIVSGQMDADRADYLLRDSHHIGVKYGNYDLDRLLTTLTAVEDPETGSPILAVEEGGLHAAEGLIIARYMMFTQVYFHRTRRAYDHHVTALMRFLFSKSGGKFPPPSSKRSLREYLKWDDWRVVGRLAAGKRHESGEVILKRLHDRCVYETPESLDFEDLKQQAQRVRDALGDKVSVVDNPKQSWYKFDDTDIPIVLRGDQKEARITKLSDESSVVKGLKPVNQSRIYVRLDDREEQQMVVEQIRNSQE